MLQSYLKSLLHLLLRNRLYSLVTITGLATGLAACLLILAYVSHERSWETHWDDADRLYRVNFAARFPDGNITRFTEIPLIAMPAIADWFRDGIEAHTRVIWRGGQVVTEELSFDQTLYQVDAGFTDLFQYRVVEGDMSLALSGPGMISLRRDTAERLFGGEPAVGRTIMVEFEDSVSSFEVAAVYEVPGNTIVDLPMMSLINEAGLPEEVFRWISLSSDSYFKLREGVDIQALNAGIAEFTDAIVDVSAFFPDPGLVTSEVALYSFQAMTDIYLNSPWDTFRQLGDADQVLAFSVIAALILLIGCFNFTILATARATWRAREVAMHKLAGARRSQLVIRFLGESFFLVSVAMMLALVLVEFLLPGFQVLTGKVMEIDYLSGNFLVSASALLILVSVLGGLYPALVLSGFYPAAVMKSAQPAEKGGVLSVRNALVAFQFGIAISLILATSVIYLQVEYSSHKDPGYDSDHLLVVNRIDSRRYLYDRMETFRQQLELLSQVESVSFSTWQPSQKNSGVGSYDLVGENAGNHVIARTGIGFDFFRTYRIPLIAGRPFQNGRDTVDPIFTLDENISDEEFTADRNIMINAAASAQLGFADPRLAVGRRLSTVSPEDGARNYTIIGVVADTHFYSLNAAERAEVFHLTPNRPNAVTIRFTGQEDLFVDELSNVWQRVVGDEALAYAFVDDLLAAEFGDQKNQASMLLAFSVLAIVIACLGLYGSSVYAVDRRTREIGIRRVLGAEVREIIGLLLWQFSKPVLLANLVAWPLSFWAMLRWLQQFSYQINALWLVPLCVVASMICLSIAWLTISCGTYRAALARPTESLRYE